MGGRLTGMRCPGKHFQNHALGSRLLSAQACGFRQCEQTSLRPFNAFGCAGKRRRIIGGDEHKTYHNVNFETSEVNNTLMFDTLCTISLKHERP